MTRGELLLILTLAWLVLGATCVPLYQEPAPKLPPGNPLGVSIQAPVADGNVPQGTVLDIRWTAVNDTELAATAQLLVESRVDLQQTVIEAGVPVSGRRQLTTSWDTAGFAEGLYVIYAKISTSEDAASATGLGRVTVDASPTFQFTKPTTNVAKGSADLEIAWSAFDQGGKGKAKVGLDPDSDHTGGNEIYLHEATLAESTTEGSFDWNGKDLDEKTVAAGTYKLFAQLTDETNPETFGDAGVQITVPAEGENKGPLTLGIVSPDQDVSFLGSDVPLEIKFSVNELNDVLIDLKIDTDDNHNNGNERAILSQRLVSGGTQTDTFSWNGKYADGTVAPNGIYRLVIVMNTGGAEPETAEGKGLVNRRNTARQPLIAMLAPADILTVNAGDYVRIRWRDDDPTKDATIRITMDDDPNPGEGEIETPILSGRKAGGKSEVEDSYLWQVPNTLAPGTYYVFGYIAPPVGNPGDPEVELASVAPGRLIIKDPSKP